MSNDKFAARHQRRQRRRELYSNWSHNGSVSMNLVVGLLIAILGVMFLIANLDIIEMRSPLRYFWAVALFAVGTALMIERRSERSRLAGIGFIVAGVWTFAYQRRWIDLSIWELFVPLLMLAGGAYLIRRAIVEKDEAPDRNASPVIEPRVDPAASYSSFDTQSTSSSFGPTSGPEASGSSSNETGARSQANYKTADRCVRGIGFLSGSELKPTSQAFERAELYALMGGVKLDLYDAQLRDDSAIIHVGACMGGIEIHAPSEWTVISNVVPLMGAFVDKRRPIAAGSTAPRKTLTITGFALMGGVEIKN